MNNSSTLTGAEMIPMLSGKLSWMLIMNGRKKEITVAVVLWSFLCIIIFAMLLTSEIPGLF